jgi:hypothetical protein
MFKSSLWTIKFVLESIHIFYCSNFIQQIIHLTKPFKLKSLFKKADETIVSIESIELLLQKFGVYLENFGFSSFTHYFCDSEPLLELITK